MIVIDAGGGTIDISGYTVENQNPLRVEEIFASECMSVTLFDSSASNSMAQVAYLGLLPSQKGPTNSSRV